MIRPFHTLFFVAIVGGILTGISAFFPGKHEWFLSYKIPSLRVYIPSLPRKISEDSVHAYSVMRIIRMTETMDSSGNTSTSDTVQTMNEGTNKTERAEEFVSDSLPVPRLYYSRPDALQTLFKALQEEAAIKPVHILHYGDSQIESDRITDYLRMKFQNRFGGRGPGLIGIRPLTQGVSCKIFSGDEWQRHVTFLGKNHDVPHNCFGPAAILYRFTPYSGRPDSLPVTSARVSWQINALGGNNMKGYNRIRLLYGGGKKKTWMEYYENGILIHADSLNYGSCTLVKEIEADEKSNQQEFRFYGRYSPDFYGISLESSKGIFVDNIAQRGSSGTFFHLIQPEQFRFYYNLLEVRCILLQFGGNALPNLKNEDQVRNYATYIRGQLALLRKITPDATVIFIGPADMGVKEQEGFVTHPLLELLRDELKHQVLSSGMVYFDLYECMGGKNSMSIWVREKLAADDYIHFSPQGARKIAIMLHSAIIKEFQQWSKNVSKK